MVCYRKPSHRQIVFTSNRLISAICMQTLSMEFSPISAHHWIFLTLDISFKLYKRHCLADRLKLWLLCCQIQNSDAHARTEYARALCVGPRIFPKVDRNGKIMGLSLGHDNHRVSKCALTSIFWFFRWFFWKNITEKEGLLLVCFHPMKALMSNTLSTQ